MLDYEILLDRIQKHKEGYDEVAGKDIVFFIGHTGAGKTTTILYLAGKEIKLELAMAKYGRHEVEEYRLCCDAAMPGFVIGHQSVSETIAVKRYDCPLSDLTFVDFAGQLDTNGPEIEIANTVGLYNTLARVRTVRLVLVINCKDLETTKAQNFTKCYTYVNGFVPNLNQKLSSLVFLFTHDPNLRTLRAELAKLTQYASKTQADLGEFLEHLINYVTEKGDALLVDPTNAERRAAAIEVVKNSTPLETCDGNVRFFLPNETRVLLVERLRGILAVVQHNLRSYAWNQVKQPIEDLHLLSTEMSMMQEIVELYDNAKAMVIKSAQDLVAKIHTLVNINDYKAADTYLGHLILLASIARLRDRIKSGIDIENSLKDVREVINTCVTAAEREIETTESYVLVRQRLDQVKNISSHLQSHLGDANKVLAAKLENLLQERVTRQYTDILSQINLLSREGNRFVEAQDKYLTELLAYNLSIMAEVDKLFEGCTHYHKATETLNKVLAFHGTKFVQEISTEPVSTELALSFMVLQEFNRSQLLAAHTSPESRSLYGNCERTLSQLLDELHNSIGMHMVNYDFTPIAQLMSRIHSLSKIDVEVCAQFVAQKLAQTVAQMQTLIGNMIGEVQKKADEELNASTMAGCDFIRSKYKLLREATKVEREFADPTIVSCFLTRLHDNFLDKARQLLNALEDTLESDVFGDSQQGKELCILLDVGIIPEAAQEFRVWTSKFQEMIRATELKVEKHIQASAYVSLALDFRLLGTLHQFNSSFLMFGKEDFSVIASSITIMTSEVLDKIKIDWQQYHGQFLDMLKTIGPQLTAVALKELKTNMITLIEKLKEINDTNMEQHLAPLKPSVELPAVAKALRTRLNVIESETRTMIAVAHLDTAERNLPIIDLLFTVLGSVDTVEGMPYSTLSSSLREKRLNLVQQIPDRLAQQHFKQAAKILRDMQAATGEVERREFENTCMIVEDYFGDLLKTVRCTTVESVHAATKILQIFDKALVLDSVVPEFGIDTLRAKVAAKVKAYVDKHLRNYQQLLNDCKFTEALELQTFIEDLIAQHPDLNEFASVNIQGEIEKHVREVPEKVASILDRGRSSNINKIDKFLEQLEKVQGKLSVNVEDVVSAIEEQISEVVRQKDSTITKLISQFNIEGATKELNSLMLLVDLKCVARLKPQGIVDGRREDIESSRRSQFSWTELQHNPARLSEDLAALKQSSHADYTINFGSIQKRCYELAEEIKSKLSQEGICCVNSIVILRPLADHLRCFQNIVESFSSNHKTFSKELQHILNNEILPKLHDICMTLQNNLHKDMRATKWENAENTIKVMEAISRELAGFVMEDFVQNIKVKSAEIRSKTSEVAESVKFLLSLNLFEPINIEMTVGNLGRLKDNASIRNQLDSFPDFESYDEVIAVMLGDVEQKEKAAVKLYGEKKYEQIVSFLENLQQGNKFVKHDALAIGFTERYKSLTKTIFNNVSDLETKAVKAHKEEKLPVLDEIQKVHSRIFKYFSAFSEIFPSAKNNILDALLEYVSFQTALFRGRFSSTSPTIDDVVTVLLRLKMLSSTISNPDLAPHVHTEINNTLNFLLGKKNFDFLKLGNDLCSSSPLGRDIVEGDNFPQFKAVVITIMNKVIARMTPEDAMKKLAKINKWTDTSHLEAMFRRCNAHFEKLLQKYLMSSSSDVDTLVLHTRAHFDRNDWQNIPENLAAIFAVWSLTSSEVFQESKNMDVVLRPHPIQMLTVMCMLGLHTPGKVDTWLTLARNIYDKLTSTTAVDKIPGHLVQIGTGEGKSVILGILSIVLALLGCEVSCACYSSYLSERDYHAFLDIFTRFGVDKHIRYSTLSQLAGSYIDEEGDIRLLTNQFVEGTRSFLHTPKLIGRPRVLLIDEVDTFLSRDFYGATYNPCTILHNDNVNFILEYIWKNQTCTLATIRGLEGFRNLTAKYKDISRVIEGAIQRMILEVKNVNDPPYFCVKNKLGQTVIGYQENGTVSTSIQHGYRTCFAYLQARDKGKVTNEIVQQHLGLTINCGQFSYAEIPKEYQCILGVTGTLETLCDFEKKVKDETYKITQETFAPSIYGDSRLTFQQVEDVMVMSDLTNYHMQLIDTITKKQKAMQPVLVFFESELQLDAFATSDYCKGLTHNVIKENTENIDFYIRKATRVDTVTGLPEVTFLLRVFGRGLDFACRDDRINKNRGIHVIQAFLSEDASEEAQIKGRTARQGEAGSYCLILNANDLERQFEVTANQIKEQKHASKLYQFIHQKRMASFAKKSEDRKKIVERSKQLHHESLEYRQNLSKSDKKSVDHIVTFLESQNPLPKPKSRIVFLSDATASMTDVWDNAKSQIVDMVNRIIAIGGEGKSELQWVAFRDYSDKKRLECSPWSNNPAVLKDFINKIVCDGGKDFPEAVELGLEHANKMKDITRVVLIGDAPPHLERKGTKLSSHNFTLTTDYKEQATLLAAKGVPVFCFYMNEKPELVKSFQEISAITGGKATLFNNTKILIDIVAENVLDDIGGNQMVLEYRKTYHS